MVNTKLIKARMKALGLTQRAVARKSKINESVLSLKMTNKRAITTEEIDKLQPVLLIPDSEIKDYFWCKEGERNAARW